MQPLIFVVHRGRGNEYPCLYYDDLLPRKHDTVVYSLRLDKQPNAVALAEMPLTELYRRFCDGRELGALPPSEAVGTVGR